MTLVVLLALGELVAFDAASAQTQADARKGSPEAPRALSMQSLLSPGPQARKLAREIGTWDVTMRIWSTAGARPVVVTGLVAERMMVGLYLTEVLRPALGSGQPDFRRVDDLTYDSLQGRWEYVSMDTRAPVGIMFARGFEVEPGADTLTVFFDNFANPGIGSGIGETIRARHVDSRESMTTIPSSGSTGRAMARPSGSRSSTRTHGRRESKGPDVPREVNEFGPPVTSGTARRENGAGGPRG